MDNRLSQRVRKLQSEVSEIAAAHLSDTPYRKGNLEKQLLYEQRLERLRAITDELRYMLQRAA
jgi:hypothetical protein